MKGQLKASTPEEYIAQLKEPRKSEVTTLDALVQKATKLKPFIQMGILAYGAYRAKIKSAPERDWFRIGIASNASYISLYITGRSCTRLKKLADLDTSVLKKMLSEGAKAKPADAV